MSYDTIILIDKNFQRIIQEHDVAYLDIARHSKCRISKLARKIFNEVCSTQKEYDLVLEKYAIDKSENVQNCLRKAFVNSGQEFPRTKNNLRLNLLFRRKKDRFLVSETFIDEIRAEVMKSADKVASITKFLKILHLLQYCKRKDMQKELWICCNDFLYQMVEVWKIDEHLVVKPIVEMLKVICVSDFKKVCILVNYGIEALRLFLFSSKLQKYNFLDIFENIETEFSVIVYTLVCKKLPNLKLLLINGARNFHSITTHEKLFDCFDHELFLRDLREDDWYLNLRICNKRNFLVMQVIYLFLCFNNKREFLPTEILVLLWKSIADPYLSIWEILHPYENKSVPVKNLLYDCWLWYYLNVICLETRQTRLLNIQRVSPRCLKHLARCEVRNMLTASYLDPTYLKDMIPLELQEYLQI